LKVKKLSLMGTQTITPATIKNNVLLEDFKTSRNFFNSDRILKHYFQKYISAGAKKYYTRKLETLGAKAATEMDELSMLADKQWPQLKKRDHLGNTINEIVFHPSYWEMMKIAVESELFRVKWEPSLRSEFNAELHALGFSAGYLYGLSEMGQYCPLCMTDGVARLIDLFSNNEDKARLLKHIYTDKPDDFFTGAMFLTEKSGGSDVGRNIVKAEKAEDGTYRLYGEKWFCSNANADIIFALARTNDDIPGTKGLSIFLVEKKLPDGSRNHIDIVRIKDKLGVRSMASAECILDGAHAIMVGAEFQGFKIMTEMINLSRLYNSVAAVSGGRRALIEAYNFLKYRITFGKKAIEHALIRHKLLELGSLNAAGFYLTWRTVRALDAADNGNAKEAELLRMLTPMVKKWTAEKSVYITRESMELMGGMGYIEDGVVPKIIRDVMVLPIWEGSGNVIILDMLRASFKSKGFEIMCKEIAEGLTGIEDKSFLEQKLNELIAEASAMKELAQDEMEISAKNIFSELTTLYQIALMNKETDETSAAWTKNAIYFLTEQLKGKLITKNISVKETEDLIAWEI
jgi:acyl-CoA dehydrogenase